MGALEIAIIVIVAAGFAAAVGYIIYRKVKHKGGCDCGCEGCPHSCNCGGEKKQK
ncbi:MAG: FeoB-associated Cys-rich membrane protein [Clostridia bacterium]|nr:FeoB-associated Cys-rich membrane protein [Clostridia bacterium]